MMSTVVPTGNQQDVSPVSSAEPRLLLARPALAIVKKELRELLPWMVGLGVVFGLLVILLFYSKAMIQLTENVRRDTIDPPRLLVSDLFMLATSVGCPLIGLLIGFVQFSKENGPDRYALLVHRPIRRGRIFLFKVMAGFTAYVIAAGLPLAGALAWASSSHFNRSPFIWPMALPTLADLLAGLPYYLAGIVLAMRVWNRWLGTRILPLGLPIITSVLVVVQRSFAWVPLTVVIALLPMAASAFGGFVAYGQIRKQRWVARTALGITITVALYLLAGILAIIIEVATYSPQFSTVFRGTAVLADGTVVRYKNEAGGLLYETLDGKFIGPENRLPAKTLNQEVLRLIDANTSYMMERDLRYRLYENYFSYIGSYWLNGIKLNAFRYVDANYIVLYDNMTGALYGSLGANGLEHGKMIPAAKFSSPVDIFFSAAVIHGTSIYRTLPDGSYEKLFDTPDGQEIRLTSSGHFAWDPNRPLPTAGYLMDYCYIATPKTIYRLRLEYRAQLERVEIADQMPMEPGDVGVTLLMDIGGYGKTKWVATRFDNWMPMRADRYSKSLLVIRDKDGQLTRKEIPASYWDGIGRRQSSLIEKIGETLLPAVVTVIGTVEVMVRQHKSAYAALTADPLGVRMAVGGLVVGLAAAAAMWRIMARQSFQRRQRILWSVLAFVFGPVMLLVRTVIVPGRLMEPCPACGKKRPAELVHCPHCGKPWPAPERDGREIFGQS